MNYLKYKSIFRGPGGVGVAGGNYTYGQTFVVPADQAQKLVPQTLLEQRLIEFMGEVDENGMSISTNFVNYIEGIAGTAKRNYMPTVTFEAHLPDTAFDTEDTMGLIGLHPKRNIALDKIIAKAAVLPSTDDGAGALKVNNRVNTLVLKGDYGVATQITTTAYIDQNGTLTSMSLPDTNTQFDDLNVTNDTVYIGYSSKFSGMYVDMTTDVNGAAGSHIASIKYWDGSDWVAFTHFDDLTERVAQVSLAGDGWIAWYEKPSDWSPYDAVATAGTVNSGSKLTKNTYWVAIKWAATLGANVEVERIWVPDAEPIANIKFQGTIPTDTVGTNIEEFGAIVQKVGAVYTDLTGDVSPIAENWAWDVAANDALYVAYSDRFRGLVVDVGDVNDVPNVMTVSYWNGAEFIDVAAADLTDGTATAGPVSLGQDGTVTFLMPSDWKKATKVEVLAANAPAGTPATSMFWIKATLSVQAKAGTDVNFIWPVRSATIPIEVNVTDNTVIMPHEQLHLYVGEVESETDALSGVKLEFIGADI